VVCHAQISKGLVHKSRPLGQDVPPRVWYGTVCLLIRDVMGSVACFDEGEVAWSFA
jgi:hypothetical protein